MLASPQEFGNTLVASSDRLRTKLLGLQAEAPNTWKAAHTLLAFNAAAAEFGHRIHIYQDQVRLPQRSTALLLPRPAEDFVATCIFCRQFFGAFFV